MEVVAAAPEADQLASVSERGERLETKIKKNWRIPTPDNIIVSMPVSGGNSILCSHVYGDGCPGCEDEFDEHLSTCRRIGRTGKYQFLATEQFIQYLEEDCNFNPTPLKGSKAASTK